MPSAQRPWILWSLVVTALLASSATAAAQAPDWSRFRGPNGTGIVPDAGYPTEFGPDKNLKWRSAVRPGKSSPVLSSRHVFLTAEQLVSELAACGFAPDPTLPLRQLNSRGSNRLVAIGSPVIWEGAFRFVATR